MKKLFSLFLAVIMIVAILPVSAFAVETNMPTDTCKPIVITNLSTGEVYDAETYRVETSGVGTNDISKTVVADISLDSKDTRSSVTDAGVTVRITCTTSASKSGNTYRMTKFTAKYELLDAAFTISNRKVKTANYGAPQLQQNVVSNYIWNYTPTSNSFTKSYSNLPWVNSVGAPGFVGGFAECKISRGSSSWSLQGRDFVVENGLL